MIFHTHKWIEFAVHRIPPITRDFEIEGASSSDLLKMCSGFTVIVDRCSKCGALNQTHILGNIDD